VRRQSARRFVVASGLTGTLVSLSQTIGTGGLPGLGDQYARRRPGYVMPPLIASESP